MFQKITTSIESAPLKTKQLQTPQSVRDLLSGASNFLNRNSISSDSSSKQFQSNLLSATSTNSETKKVLITAAMEDSNFDRLVKNISDKMQMKQTSGVLSTSNSADLLSISPIFGKPFDTQSIEDTLITPADDDLIRGIRNINYDIDFSDSPENSLAEEIAEIRKYSSIVGDFPKERIAMSKSDLEEFDPLMSKEDKNFTRSLIDESPNDLLLENPLLPTRQDYRGFSSQTNKIHSINCETGNNSTSSQK